MPSFYFLISYDVRTCILSIDATIHRKLENMEPWKTKFGWQYFDVVRCGGAMQRCDLYVDDEGMLQQNAIATVRGAYQPVFGSFIVTRTNAHGHSLALTLRQLEEDLPDLLQIMIDPPHSVLVSFIDGATCDATVQAKIYSILKEHFLA